MAEDEADTRASLAEPTPKRGSRENNTKPYKSVPADEECYGTSNARRGIALVLDYGEYEPSKREGTEKDRSAIVKTLKDLKFDVREFAKSTVDELRRVLMEVAKEDHSKNDCLMVVVMSHANDSDYEIEELWKYFQGYNCSSLIGKPKLFFIQACRGYKKIDGSIETGGDETDGKVVKGTPTVFCIPQLTDLLIVLSTFEGSYPAEGTRFIKSLCEELKENSNTVSLQELILGVTRRVADYQIEQIPTTLSTLTKRLIFTKN